MTQHATIPYGRIPHFPRTTISGHQGNLVIGSVEKTGVILLQGRFHYYEGHDLETVTFPIRVLQRLGVNVLILTAATGGINLSFGPGTLVVLSDHLNLIGANPSAGPTTSGSASDFPISPRCTRLGFGAGREGGDPPGHRSKVGGLRGHDRPHL